MQKTVTLYPKTTMLDRFRRDTALTQAKAIAELIDNSLDAGARKVEIEYDRAEGYLRIKDNGSGCSNITRMLQIGSDKSVGAHQKLGRYGQGFNAAVLRFGDHSYIYSCDSLSIQSIRVDWNKVVTDGTWNFTFDEEIAPTGSSTGVTVVVSHLQIHNFQLADIVEESARRFRPALLAGSKITIAGQRLKPVHMPLESQLSDQITDSILIRGRVANVRAGRLTKASSDWAGFWVRYKHRYILMANFQLARSGGHSMRFFCDVELQDGTSNWELDTNKNNLAENDFEMLKDALTAKLAPLYDLLKEESQKVICEDLNAIIAEAFKDAEDEMGDATRQPKEKGDEPPAPPAPSDGNEGSPHEKAKNINPREGGKYHRKKRVQPGFEIKIDDFGNNVIGFDCELVEGVYVVTLNRQHPLIADREDDMPEMAMLASSTILLKQYELDTFQRLPGLGQLDSKKVKQKLSAIWSSIGRNFPIAKHKVA
jgi:hypothetical protein